MAWFEDGKVDRTSIWRRWGSKLHFLLLPPALLSLSEHEMRKWEWGTGRLGKALNGIKAGTGLGSLEYLSDIPGTKKRCFEWQMCKSGTNIRSGGQDTSTTPFPGSAAAPAQKQLTKHVLELFQTEITTSKLFPPVSSLLFLGRVLRIRILQPETSPSIFSAIFSTKYCKKFTKYSLDWF